MSAGHHHSHVKTTQERPLLFALILTSIFLLIEVIGGLVTQSLALIADAAHMLTDVTALAISLLAIKIGRRSADLNRTFGYYRFEILAAVFNTILLFLVALYIIYEAYQRLSHPAEIHSIGMLIIAFIGLVVNLISMRLLTAGKNHSMNMKSAYLEVWSDMLGSVGVILAAAIIYFTGWKSVDSVIAILIGLWVLPRTFVLLKESINILLDDVYPIRFVNTQTYPQPGELQKINSYKIKKPLYLRALRIIIYNMVGIRTEYRHSNHQKQLVQLIQ